MLIALDLSTLVALMLGGVALDWLLGEVRRWHPLVGFGSVANCLERLFNRGGLRYANGVFAWCLAVAPLVLLAYWLIDAAGRFDVLLHVVLLYFCLGLRSLRDHVLPIEKALQHKDLALARQLASRIVSRDTARADAADIAKAAVESTLENGNDAVFATLFWFVIAGGPGALLFRLVNTLDAMWGYRTARFIAFGWMAARADDVLNWIPARLTALSYMLLGDGPCARHCWRTQAAAWPSPNAGPVMSAGAGALGLALGGSAEYDGVLENRPPLGIGRAAAAADIRRAWQLVARTCVLWIAMLAIAAFLVERGMHA